MAGRIYLLKEDSKLLAMEEAPYDSESLLQKLLADHPDLLAGDQIDAEEPRRWLLVTREMAVPGEQDGAGRWSLDHLFLDQDAIPTLVEVKRSSDTRIRREVIGQMLDYAANAVAYWPVEEIKAKFESRCKDDGDDPETELVGLLGEGQDISTFWQSVKTNLQAGRVRLLFIADEIPTELRRVVEFLNSQMDPAEVLAIEVKQFVGENLKTLVPRVVGQTETARQKKKVDRGESRQWDETSFFSDLSQRRGEQEAAVARRLLDWAKNHGLRVWWGQGKKDGSFFPIVRQQVRPAPPLLRLDLRERRASVSTHESPAVRRRRETEGTCPAAFGDRSVNTRRSSDETTDIRSQLAVGARSLGRSSWEPSTGYCLRSGRLRAPGLRRPDRPVGPERSRTVCQRQTR